MAKKTAKPVAETVDQANVSLDLLAKALASAINMAKPKEKVRISTPRTPWSPKDGGKKLKFKRKAHLHGVALDEDYHTNEEIALFNKLRPGIFFDGFVKVTRRRDRGIDIDWPMKTAAQRLKMVNQFGMRNISEILTKCIAEAENPVKERFDADGDPI